jgi:hypothetical protein
VIDAAEIDAKPFFAPRRDRIEEPDALDVLPAACSAAIRHDHVIERTLDRAAAGEPNDYHNEKP